MTDQFEQDIQDWYKHSRTANLEYLNLENPQKITLSVLNNNLSCVYDKVFLHAKVCIKRFHQIIESQLNLLSRIESCEELIKNTQSETRKSLQRIQEIITQPSLVAEETLKITEELDQKIQKVEHLLHEVKGFLIS